MDVLIPIVFPDYLISTPAGKLPELGHAGVLLILGSTGTTKYYEYGRYDKANLGLVRKVTIPDVAIDKTSKKPDMKSLANVLQAISQKSGQSGRISAAYIEVAGGFSKANSYAQSRLKSNTDPKRKPYAILSHSCLHFMQSTLEEAGIKTPWLVDPRPNSYIEELRNEFPDLDYQPGDKEISVGS